MITDDQKKILQKYLNDDQIDEIIQESENKDTDQSECPVKNALDIAKTALQCRGEFLSNQKKILENKQLESNIQMAIAAHKHDMEYQKANVALVEAFASYWVKKAEQVWVDD